MLIPKILWLAVCTKLISKVWFMVCLWVFFGLLNISSCQYWIMTMVDTCLNTTGPLVVGLYKEQKECLFSLNQVYVFFYPKHKCSVIAFKSWTQRIVFILWWLDTYANTKELCITSENVGVLDINLIFTCVWNRWGRICGVKWNIR